MQCSWIEPGILAASGIPISPDDIRSLRDQGIRAILTLTEHPITNFSGLSTGFFSSLDIVYKHVPVVDQCAPESSATAQILQFIHEMQAQQRPVLVHCHAGIGRTGTILYLYYLDQGLSLDEAKARIKSVRPQCTLLSNEQFDFLRTFTETR